MLCKCKPSSLNLVRYIIHYHSLLQHRTKTTRSSARRKSNDDDGEICRKKENEEGSIYFYKSKGQHILTNPRVLDTIVRQSDIRPTDTVLEIGPGTGNLTLRLLQASKKVVAVELDRRMVEFLNKRVSELNLQDGLSVICKDALKTEFPGFDLVVANIPYGISSPLVTKLVYGTDPFRSATLLLQKEFARRLLANPGDSEFNRLAVNVKLLAEVEFVMDVSKRDFVPCPKVDSSVVIIRPKAEIPNVNLDEYRSFTRTCFGNKNKTLGATFKQKRKVLELLILSKVMPSTGESTIKNNDCCDNGDEDNEDEESESDGEDADSSSCEEMEARLFKEKLVGILKSAGFEDKRPSKLSIEEFLHLLFLFNQSGICFHDHNEGMDVDNVAIVNANS